MKIKRALTALLFGLTLCLTNCEKCRETQNPACNETAPTDGICQAYFTTWFYNKDKKKCEQIGYSGCSASGFATEQECQECQCN